MDNSNSGLTASDVLAITKNNDNMGGGLWWIIIFFIVAGVFNGGMFGNNGAAYGLYDNEFIKRDIFNTNQNVSNSACTTQRDVLENRYQLGKDTLENRYQLGRDIADNRYAEGLNTRDIIASQKDCCCTTQQNIIQSRYDNAIGQANIQKDILLNNKDLQKDILLGQANAQKDLLLGNQAIQSKMAECCCDLKTTMHNEGEATRALITQNRIEDLQYQLNQANTAVANAVQTRTILDTIGRYNVVAVPPYSYGYGYGASNGNYGYGYGYGVSGVV